jgi:hypothetical protein
VSIHVGGQWPKTRSGLKTVKPHPVQAIVARSLGNARSPPPQIGESMLPPQLRQVTFAVSDMRAIVEWLPQSGQSERNSYRRRQKTQR